MQNRTILHIKSVSQNRAGLNRVLMPIILPLPVLGRGHINAFLGCGNWNVCGAAFAAVMKKRLFPRINILSKL